MSLKKLVVLIIIIIVAVIVAVSCQAQSVMRGAFREDRAGWSFIHLEGASREIGYQHGRLLAAEIDGVLKTFAFYLKKETGRDWAFYRGAAEKVFWPRLERPIRMEIEGLAEGLRAGKRGLKYDRFDIAALNGIIELAWYYEPALKAKSAEGGAGEAARKPPLRCSAFIATGGWTADGRIVMGHNTWDDYIIGERWNVILDIVPDTGRRMLMDAIPGFIHSGSDFVVNEAGLVYTETTISGFAGFDEKGVPEFARARTAAQYAASIDDFIRIMTTDGNGGYANDWLVGDVKTNEIARLELGLKNHRIWRTTDGWFAGANFPLDEKLIAEETTFNPDDADQSVYIRRDRWEQLMAENKGKIDVEKAMEFLGDHVDARSGEVRPSARTLCGHIDRDPAGAPEANWGGFSPSGAVQAKVTSAGLAGEMKIWVRMGHPCGEEFLAAPFAAAHPEYAWQLPYLRDMKANPWVLFQGR